MLAEADKNVQVFLCVVIYFVLHGDGFYLHAPSPCLEMIENTNAFLFISMNSIWQVISIDVH